MIQPDVLVVLLDPDLNRTPDSTKVGLTTLSGDVSSQGLS
jgi:hypothetical protein